MFTKENKYRIILLLLFVCHIFFLLYNLERWAFFGWDQVNNAWAAHRILEEGKFPLLGFQAKGNSGMFIGPAYYYLITPFYYLTQLDPIASSYFAAFTGIISFLVLYGVSKRIFDENIALVSCGIYTFSSFIIHSERIQWLVNFMAPVSFLIYYFLYKVLSGNVKYLPLLALMTGLSFHVHFTSIFYPLIILFTLPLFPWRKITLKLILLSVFLFLVTFIGQILYYFMPGNTSSLGNYSAYFQTYFHGFHLRRLLQVSFDAFIPFQQILEVPYRFVRNTIFLYLPVFGALYGLRSKVKNSWKLVYITALWILVPWIAFTTYSGEISDYYFINQLFLAVTIYAYITVWLWNRRNVVLRLALVMFWLYWGAANIRSFLRTVDGNYLSTKHMVQQLMTSGEKIEFVEGDAKSYWYIYLLYKQKQPYPY